MNRQLFGFLITLLGGICWGFSGVCGQYLFTEKSISADFLVTWRLLIAGILMSAWCAYKYKRLVLEPFMNIKDLSKLLLFGIFGISLCQYSYFYAVELSNAPVATTISYTAPAFLLVIMCLYEKRWPNIVETSALLLAMLGIFLISTHASFSSFVISAKALFFAILSAVCVVIYTLSPKIIDKKYPITLSLALGMVLGGIVLAFIVRVWESSGIYDFSGLLAFLSITIIGTIIAFSLFLSGVLIIGPTKAALIACIEPVAAVFFSTVWLGTKIYPIDYVGLALILICVALLRKG